MAELADALDLGSSGEIHGGSSPFTRTKLIKFTHHILVCFFILKIIIKCYNLTKLYLGENMSLLKLLDKIININNKNK